jgi:hypothetical protein
VCQFNNGSNALNFININNVNLYNCTIQGTGALTFNNAAFGYIEGPEGLQDNTTLTLIDNPGGNVPSQYSGNYVLCSSTKLYGTVTIDAGSELDLLQTYLGSSSSVTNNGTIHSWDTNWGNTVALNNGSTLRTQGDTFKTAPTVNAGATFTYLNTGYNATQVAHNFSATGATSGTVSILPQAAAGTYNFNLPTTAGTSTYVLTSAGGGSSPMTWTNPTSLGANTLTGDVTGTNSGGSIATSLVATSNATLTTLSALTTATSLASVGTITTGTWHGTAIDATHGGTNQTTWTTGDLLYASGSNTLSKLAIGSSTNVLTVSGGVPVWSAASAGTVTSVALSVPASSLFSVSGSPVTSSGTLAIATAGTSGGIPYFSSTTQMNSSALLVTNGLVLGGGAGSAPTTLATNASTAFPLVSGGTGTAPSWAGLTVAGGGTGLTTLTTAYGLVAAGTTATGALQNVGTGTTSQVLVGAGSAALPTWGTVPAGAVTTSTFIAPTTQTMSSTGSTTGWAFIVSSANATAGATYTNNGHTYTVADTISASTLLFTTQASAPTANGTLTKSGGTGDSTITFSSATALGTYTTPTSPRTPVYLRVRLVGGGGGGAGGGTTNGGGSTAGGASYFEFGPCICNGGSTGNGGTASPFAGGGATRGTASGVAQAGGDGSGSNTNAAAAFRVSGGSGGVSAFGGAGGSGYNAVGTAGKAGSGSGGGGGGGDTTTSNFGGGGGGAGGYVDITIPSPAATYLYAVGSGGTGGTAGTAGQNGGAGAVGVLIVEEFYQ